MDAWELTVLSCTVVTSPSVERRWPPSSRRFETLKSVRTSVDAVSTFRPGRRWLLVFIATYTATSLSVNRKWCHHNSPNRATLSTGVHRVERSDTDVLARWTASWPSRETGDTPTVADIVTTASSSRHYEVNGGEPTQLVPLFVLSLQML